MWLQADLVNGCGAESQRNCDDSRLWCGALVLPVEEVKRSEPAASSLPSTGGAEISPLGPPPRMLSPLYITGSMRIPYITCTLIYPPRWPDSCELLAVVPLGRAWLVVADSASHGGLYVVSARRGGV